MEGRGEGRVWEGGGERGGCGREGEGRVCEGRGWIGCGKGDVEGVRERKNR